MRDVWELFSRLTLGGRTVFVLVGLAGTTLAILYIVTPPPPPIENELAAGLVLAFTIFALALVITLDAVFQVARKLVRRKIANPS